MGFLKGTAAVALACGIVVSGFGPADHLHPATDLHAAVVHAHPEDTGTANSHTPSTVDDDHGDAVHFHRVMAGGPARQAQKPATATAVACDLEPAGAAPFLSRPEVLPTVSPPVRSAAPRAPPA